MECIVLVLLNTNNRDAMLVYLESILRVCFHTVWCSSPHYCSFSLELVAMKCPTLAGLVLDCSNEHC